MLNVIGPDVGELLSVPEAIEAVRHGLLEHHAGRFDMPARTRVDGGSLLLMPAVHLPTGTSVTKVVTVGSRGPSTQRPATVQGVLTWFDRNGTPGLVIDAAPFTALRTAAVTAVAADLMAPAHASRLTLFGAGALAAPHIDALNVVRPLQSITLVSRSEMSSRRLAHQVADAFPGVAVRAADDPREAVAEADMVCCVTTATTPLFEAAWLGPSVHVAGAGSHTSAARELPRALFDRATSVVVDTREGALREAGEIIDALESRVLTPEDVTALGELIASPRACEGLTIFKSVGMAAEDWGLANAIAARLGLDGAEVPGSMAGERSAQASP